MALRSLRIYETLAEAALQHVAEGERDAALRMIDDALVLLDSLGDRTPFTRVLVGIGECLGDLGCAGRAELLLSETVGLADALPDVALGARARLALGRARLRVGDGACRAVLEEARSMFEELGDNESITTVDTLLRAAAAALMH